ncbi:MAG: SRPBCC family protein [Chlorobiaceae bacterium]
MHSSLRRIYWSILPLFVVLSSFFSNPSLAQPIEPAASDSLSSKKAKLLNGEVMIVLSDLPDGVIGVEGEVYIAAPPKKVWEVITDYDNHKKFVPNVIDSGTISDNGSEKVMFEKGTSGVMFFQKTVNIKMKVWGDTPNHLYFAQIGGDFKVYHGEWILVDYPRGGGTFLTYKAEVKPGFFAPRFAVKNVQKHDCPSMMTAMKKQAESLLLSELKKE